MPRHSSNFQVTELLDSSTISQSRSSFNDFGSFVYKDHITRKQYDVQDLINNSSNIFNKQPNSFVKKHRYNKSMVSLSKTKSRFKQKNEQLQSKKNQLSNFLQELVMMNRIKNNRNHIVSGTQKAQQRKSMLPSIINAINQKVQKDQNIDSLKQKIRKQVNSLNTELFREYIEKQKPYRPVFNELNVASTKGALNTKKIKQIKQKLKQCIKIKNNQVTYSLIKKPQLDAKQNSLYDQYFDSVKNEIDQDIHLKMRHQASFNWKHGKRPNIQELYSTYKTQHKLLKPLTNNQ